jgi:hypothetical protein
MKASTLKPLVLAIAATMAIAAQAGQSRDDDHGHHNNNNRDPLLDRNAGDATAYAGRDQTIGEAAVSTEGTENTADIEDSLSSSGNIGANVAAGNLNQQANNVAIATADEQFVFGSAVAESDIAQANAGWSSSLGGGSAANVVGSGNDASGNIGVNAASGNLNQQQNALAIATARGWDATATATGSQTLSGGAENKAGSVTVTKTIDVTKDVSKNSSLVTASDSTDHWDAAYEKHSDSSVVASASLSATHDSTSSSASTYDSSLDVDVDANKSSNSSSESSKSLVANVDASVDVDIEVDHGRGELEVDATGTASLDVNVDKTASSSKESTKHFDLTKTVVKSSSATEDESKSVDKTFDADFSLTKDSSKSASKEKNETHAANSSREEAEDFTLAASVTHTKSYTIANPVVNSATLSNSLNGASGNIGVNIASGSSNQQLNTLAVAAGCNTCNSDN